MPPGDSLARFMELRSPTDRVFHGLVRRAGGPSPLRAGERATVLFDTGRAAWSLLIDDRHMAVVQGRTGRSDAEIRADAETLAALVEGEISGVHAFLDGRLAIRGSIALALKLEADDPALPRPVEFARPRWVQAAGLDTFYLEAGRGPAVVLLHGLGATNASMLPTLAALARDHRVLAPDLPGFGESAKPVLAYDPAFFARWLAGFLDVLGIERAVLIGNSMGGRVALELGLVAPERVERLVLFTPSLAFKRFRAATPLVRLLAAELAAMPLFVPRALVSTVLRMMFARPERLRIEWYDAAVDEFLRVFAGARGRMAFFSAARQIYLEEAHGEAGFWERLPALRCPALFLWGDSDQLVPPRFAPHVEAALPRARSIVLEDCGHVPQFEHPERTHALMRDFLRP
ncbi:MAG TPA: alpha/beta fold hydrolase [Candidatus Limnocylindria bacterium]|nr:alpha/beta fold hydrolase [Candidatus Limnocylindria bacterium]